ncbi:MAG: YVTN family beta-propeller repeat-containing protein [Rikenellaceae bacterium]
MVYSTKHILASVLAVFCLSGAVAADKQTTPLQSTAIVMLDSGEFLFTNKGTKDIRKYSSDFSTVVKSWDFDQVPTGLAVTDTHYYVTTFSSNGELHKINAQSGEKEGSIKLESGSMYPLLTKDNKTLYVANQFQNTISKVNLESFTSEGSAPVSREPKGMVLSDDEKYMFVANFLPNQRSDIDTVCSTVTVLDLATFKPVKEIKLANGSNALRGIALSPDKKFILVSHNLGRFQVPTNQLQQGWMNTSAVSIIDVEKQKFLGAVLLDEPERGAAGIEKIAVSDTHLVVAHSGTHEVSIIEYQPFIDKFNASPNQEALSYDLTFLFGLRQRVTVAGNGPRHLIVNDDKAYVPTYFADTLSVVDILTQEVVDVKAMQPNRVESDIFKGEKYFNDAVFCFQSWQSCNGCHPGDARQDGMNWDLMNDGVGNAKNCKSLLYSIQTPPSMISGIRAMAQIANRKGFTHIQFSTIDEEKAVCVDKYSEALVHVPSPYLVNGELSELAKAGEKVFVKIGCADCHTPDTYYTDMQMHRIGDEKDFQQESGWDTPTLIETWRTAPYLFDGRAATMREVFEVYKHGINKKISTKDLDALVEFVNSL